VGVDVERLDMKICKRLQSTLKGKSVGDKLHGMYYEVTTELLSRTPTLLVPPFKSSLTYDEPSAAYRYDLHGQLQFQMAYALVAAEVLELRQWWTRISAGRQVSGNEEVVEERLRREERWRKAAEAALRQIRLRAREEEAAAEAAADRCRQLEAHLRRQTERISQLQMACAHSQLALGSPQQGSSSSEQVLEDVMVSLQEMNQSTKAILLRTARADGDGEEEGEEPEELPPSRDFLLATEAGAGNVVETFYSTEDEARAAARSTWVSYVLYDVSMPWQPREIGDGGLGFGQGTVREHVTSSRTRGPSSRVAAAGVPEYEVASAAAG
jgi:hypothetical protein